MIWSGGRIMPAAELAINIADRTFEHGLGLFETFRTWNRRAALLDRHLARLRRSAAALGLPLEESSLPGAADVAALLASSPVPADALVRITLTGGLSDSGGSVVWMRAAELTVKANQEPSSVGGFWEVAAEDRLARHKSLNYWRHRLAYEQARAQGLDESLSRSADGAIWEGSRTNLFWVKGQTLFTPPLDGPIVPGVMRGLVLERAPTVGLDVLETTLDAERLRAADEVFLTNSVRGILPVNRLERMGDAAAGRAAANLGQWDAPGRWTLRLEVELMRCLSAGDFAP
jgi:branched-chain amino acid aminotransferase